MGLAKKDLEKKEQNNYDSKFFCTLCGLVIPKDDIEFAKQGESLYMCSECRAKREHLEKE